MRGGRVTCAQAFLAENAKEDQNEMADKWKKMSEAAKAPYIAKAEKDKARFKAEEERWKATQEALARAKAGTVKVQKKTKKGKK